jgi:hypothetical protein
MCELVAHPGRQVKEKCELFTFFGARFAPLWRRSFWFWGEFSKIGAGKNSVFKMNGVAMSGA